MAWIITTIIVGLVAGTVTMYALDVRRCNREGHPEGAQHIVKRHRFEWPSKSFFNAVADEVTLGRKECRRCFRQHGEWEELSRESLQGLTMSPADWRKLKEDGHLDRRGQ